MKYNSTDLPIRILQKKGAEIIGNEIIVQKDAMLGIKVWGKLDYLRTQGYRLKRVDSVAKYLKSLTEGRYVALA